MLFLLISNSTKMRSAGVRIRFRSWVYFITAYFSMKRMFSLFMIGYIVVQLYSCSDSGGSANGRSGNGDQGNGSKVQGSSADALSKEKGVQQEGVDSLPCFVVRDTIAVKTVELPAELLPNQQVDLLAKVSGYVKSLRADMGDRVKAGQTLAIIEAPELETKYAEMQASLQLAAANRRASQEVYTRMKQAAEAKTVGIVAPVDLERAKQKFLADSAAYEARRLEAQSFKQVAGYLVVQAPFSGVITSRKADPGALVGTGQPIFTLQNNAVLRLRLAVPEQYVGAGMQTDQIEFRVDAFPNKTYLAKLDRKSESIDPATRTELWEFVIDNNTLTLKAGAFAYAKIKLARKESSLLVPASAVATNQERKFVIRINEGQLQWIDVRTGLSNEQGVEIFGDLQKGDTLLLRATDERKPGSKGIAVIQPSGK